MVCCYLIGLHKKGMSSVQLAKDLDITQKSAWFLENRIKKPDVPTIDPKNSYIVTDDIYSYVA